MSEIKLLEQIDLCLRILKTVNEVELSEGERAAVRRVALAHLDASLPAAHLGGGS
jgi:hypothetical protein